MKLCRLVQNSSEASTRRHFVKPSESSSAIQIPFSSLNHLYVRKEMIDLMEVLVKHTANPAVLTQVLIGSPWVGTSVVFFLHALSLAANTDKKIMYWRKAAENRKRITLICMEATIMQGGLQGVKIQITDSIKFAQDINDIYAIWMKDAFPELFEGLDHPDDPRYLSAHVLDLLDKTVVMFADGPKHDDDGDTLKGGIHFLCSSGGHPLPHNDEIDNKIISVLCGWRKDDFVMCLEHFSTDDQVEMLWDDHCGSAIDEYGNEGNTHEETEYVQDNEPKQMELDGAEGSAATKSKDYALAEKRQDIAELIYYYAGSRIGDALKLLDGRKAFQKFQTEVQQVVSGMRNSAVDLAIKQKYDSKSEKSFDRLRTYFEFEESSLTLHMQIVDSGYVLSAL